MIFTLEVLKARKGDCLMIHLGTPDDPGLVLIDGGPATVYEDHLAPRLEDIREMRGLEGNGLLEFDLIMVSHADDDHIVGILELMDDQLDKGQRIMTAAVWHNSFDGVMRKAETELKRSMPHVFGTASLDLAIPHDIADEVEGRLGGDDEEVRDSLMILASIRKGFQLRDRVKRLDMEHNAALGGELIMTWDGAPKVPIGEGKLQLTVLGPMKPELERLQQKHVEWLQELRDKDKSPADMLAAYVDKSPTNLSSIVVLAEVGEKKMLLTGDARGDKIIEGLKLAKLLSSDEDPEPLEIDILKVPHHGSANNNDDDLFRLVPAKHYVFSGNGEHGNPARATLEMLHRARGDAEYEVHLTYPVPHIDAEREKEWNTKRKSKKSKKGPWSDQEHSIAAFLNDNPAFAKKIRIVQDGVPHLIELSDPLRPR